MPRACSICTHPEKEAINAALIASETYRKIADRYGPSPQALMRHKEHLPVTLTKAAAAKETAFADDLLEQVKQLRNKAVNILAMAEKSGDLRTALMGIREARACIELLLEVEGRLQRGSVNILIAPEWLEIRTVVLQALAPYPDARAALAVTLGREHA